MGESFYFRELKYSVSSCKSQGRRISWGSITCRGWEIKFCATILRWRSGKAGCPWVTWRAVCTTKSVRISCFFLREMHNHPPFASCDSSVLQLCFRIVLGEYLTSSFKTPCCTWQVPCSLSFQQHLFLQQLPDDVMAVPCNGWKEGVPAMVCAQSVVLFFCSYLRF